MRIFFLLCFFVEGILTYAQFPVYDTTMQTVDLDVAVVDETEQNGTEYNFYKRNKLVNTEDVLARMQGVNLIKRGPYGLEPTLRGYGTGQTNLTIDGMRMYGACTDKMDPVSIYVEPVNLQAIDVEHGASGAIAGSTIGGQINMQLREPDFTSTGTLNGKFSQAYATNNSAKFSSFYLQQGQQKWAYRLSGVYRKASDYVAGGGQAIQHSAYEKANINGVLKYKIDSFQTLKVDYLGDWGKNIGFPALPMDVGKASAQIFAITHHLMGKNGPVKHNEFKVYYNSVHHEMDDRNRPEAPMHMDMPGWSRTVGFYNETQLKNKWKLRLDFHRAYLFADMTMYPVDEAIMYLQTLPKNNLNDLGFGINRVFQMPKNQEVKVNGRLDYMHQKALLGSGADQWQVFDVNINETKIDLLKNLSLNFSKKWRKTSTAQVTAAYGQRAPTANERYGFYLFNRQDQYDYLGNLDLKPEGAYQLELLLNHRFKKLNLSVNGFYHHIQNYIYAYKMEGVGQMTIGAKGSKTYRNLDYAVTKGFEFLANAVITSKLTYLGSVKFAFSETDFKTPLPLVPPLKLQHALRYNAKWLQMQLEHDYAITQNRVNADFGDVVTPSFNVFNLRMARNFNIKAQSLYIGFDCENVLDTRYREHLDIGQIPRMGRNFLLNASYLF